MSPSVHNLALSMLVDQNIAQIHKSLYWKPAPQKLHHYTSADTFEKIVAGRALWATCLANQKDDKEITHAAELLASASRNAIRGGVSGLAADIIERLPHFMEERKNSMFVACFCEQASSERHFEEYGPYRLTFNGPGSSTQRLSCVIPKADLWYQEVAYSREEQERALNAAVSAVVEAVARCSDGISERGSQRWLTDTVARNAGQIILGMAVGFKRPEYQWEQEWRIVVCPRLGTNSSAPSSDDQDFLGFVKKSPRRHLELEIVRKFGFLEPVLRAPVPVIEWESAPTNAAASEIESITRTLTLNGRPDLVKRS